MDRWLETEAGERFIDCVFSPALVCGMAIGAAALLAGLIG